MSIKQFVLKYKILYELYFRLSGKKLNRKYVDKKILKLKKRNVPVIENLIVSLTSYGERLSDLKYTLYSLVTQSILPEKLVVWLAYNEIIPEELRVFENFGVSFEFCEDIRSYKKLIPALIKYPEKFIVTADDDIFYKDNWLLELWNYHLIYPKDKITHIAHRIKFSSNGKLEKYNNWDFAVSTASGNLFPTGCGGTLYPPQPVYSDFCKSELFMKLAPKADDVWFYFMGLLAGQKVRIVKHPQNKLKYVDIYKEYGLNGKSSLQAENVGENMNDIQIQNVMKHYGIQDKDLVNLCPLM